MMLFRPLRRRPHLPPRRPLRQGFTLIEMALVVGLMASLVAIEAERRALQSQQARRDLFVQQVNHIRLAAAQYTDDRRQTEDLEGPIRPASMADLLRAPHNDRNYLGNLSGERSAFGGDFSIVHMPPDDDLLLQADTGSEAEASLLAGRLSGIGSRADGTLLQAVLLTGNEPANSRYYLRSGALPLTGDLDAGRNALLNIFEIRTQDLIVEGTQAILSDPRSKQQISTLPGNGLALEAIRPLRYRKAGRQEIGFSAAEVARLYPQLVRQYPPTRAQGSSPNGSATDEPRLYLSYDGLLAVLWAEVRLLSARLEALERQSPRSAEHPHLD